ncbi:MAG TPA: KEOPS complex subunit Pcc1 [Nitrososphaera sp.]|nr:KEOPS complex subunit Pcc1 [Nitrososphaera sp.]
MKSYKAKIRVSTTSERIAAGIYHALAPDLCMMPASSSTTSTTTTLSLKETHVVFQIETRDIASLRANVNSYLRLADTSYKCLAV